MGLPGAAEARPGQVGGGRAEPLQVVPGLQAGAEFLSDQWPVPHHLLHRLTNSGLRFHCQIIPNIDKPQHFINKDTKYLVLICRFAESLIM